MHVSDITGARYLDGVGGLWCVNLGYGRAELGRAMAGAADALGYFHSFTGCSNRAQIELAEKLKSLTEGKFSRVFFGSSGSDANDSLIKLVWYVNALAAARKNARSSHANSPITEPPWRPPA